jgi:site-specific recombinase XerD
MTTEDTNMTTATDRFIAWQKDYNGITEHRSRQARRVLNDLGTFVGGSPEDATARDFAVWMESLAASGLHPNTVRKNGGMVRPFFKWAWRDGLISADRLFELREVPNPRGATGESTPKPYTRKEIARLWIDLDEAYPLNHHFAQRWVDGKSRWPRAWKHAAHLQLDAIIHLCLHAGLRREEVFRLTVDDLHYDNAYIVVQGAAKGNGGREYKQREVPMTVELRRAVAQWVEFRAHFQCNHDRPWVVLSPMVRPNGVIPATLYAGLSFSSYKDMLSTLGRGWSYHRLRHTYATELLRAGMPLENLKELLGHARLQQTLAYAKIVPQDNERHVKRVEADFTKALARPVA